MKLNKQALDRYITGNYGEDQFKKTNEYELTLDVIQFKGKVKMIVEAVDEEEAYEIAMENIIQMDSHDVHVFNIEKIRRKKNDKSK